ncbi:MAG: site-2 protease family protein, partial [Planctomycetota bacterium]
MSFLVNTRRMSFADFWRERTWWNLPLLFLFYFLTRLVNVQAPAFGEFPAVGQLSRHRVEAEHWPDFAADILQAAIERMSATRWTPWGSFGVETSSKNAAFFGQTYLDPDGKTLAVVSHRFYPNSTAKERRPSTVFFSKLSDGTVIVSSTGVPDLVLPTTWRIDYRRDDTADDLIAWHNQRCREIAGVRRLEPITRLGGDGVQVTESLLQEYLEFQMNRGVITESNEMLVTAVAGSTPEPAWETPQVIDADDHNEPVIAATLVESEDNVEPQGNVDSRDPMDSQSPAEQSLANLMHEIRQQETKQSGWVSKVFILGLSLLFFIWLGALNWDLQFVLLLVPILLVHELGHFIAMRCLGYRDVRMFFIPLLGAAVTGRQYGISGWKKGLVSLAGPLPSIVMGAGLAALAVH